MSHTDNCWISIRQCQKRSRITSLWTVADLSYPVCDIAALGFRSYLISIVHIQIRRSPLRQLLHGSQRSAVIFILPTELTLPVSISKDIFYNTQFFLKIIFNAGFLNFSTLSKNTFVFSFPFQIQSIITAISLSVCLLAKYKL